MANPAEEGQFIRLGAWVKFEGTVPKPSKNMGFKITGNIYNEWVSDCVPDKWKYISVVAPVTKGDHGFVLYIFDSMEDTETVKIAMPELEIFDNEPKPRMVRSKDAPRVGKHPITDVLKEKYATVAEVEGE